MEQIFVPISFIFFFIFLYMSLQYKKFCHVRSSSDEILWWAVFLCRWSSKHLAYSCLFASTLLSVPPNQKSHYLLNPSSLGVQRPSLSWEEPKELRSGGKKEKWEMEHLRGRRQTINARVLFFFFFRFTLAMETAGRWKGSRRRGYYKENPTKNGISFIM